MFDNARACVEIAQGPLDRFRRPATAAFPFKPALQAVDAAVNGSSPGIARALAALFALTLVFGAAARAGLRRFA